MNRKFHNALNAAMACSVLLVIALLAGAPVGQPVSSASTTASIAVIPASAPPAAVVAATGAEPAETLAPNRDRRASRRSYQSVRMPFFSFVPRG